MGRFFFVSYTNRKAIDPGIIFGDGGENDESCSEKMLSLLFSRG